MRFLWSWLRARMKERSTLMGLVMILSQIYLNYTGNNIPPAVQEHIVNIALGLFGLLSVWMPEGTEGKK